MPALMIVRTGQPAKTLLPSLKIAFHHLIRYYQNIDSQSTETLRLKKKKIIG